MFIYFLTAYIQVCSTDFLVYLDSEMESLDTQGDDNDPGVINSRALERMLVTVKLRVLDEAGRGCVTA